MIRLKLIEPVIETEVSHCLPSVSNSNSNTILRDTKVARNRARSWCFTLNNYTKECIVSLSHNKWNNMEINKYVFQEEIGEKKTPHLQGVVQFKNQVSFTSLKEFHNKIRWSKCRNLQASMKYCSKEDTRNGEIYTYGDVEKWLWRDKPKCNLTSKDVYDDMCYQMINGIDITRYPQNLEVGEIKNGGVY